MDWVELSYSLLQMSGKSYKERALMCGNRTLALQSTNVGHTPGYDKNKTVCEPKYKSLEHCVRLGKETLSK